jgi:glycosyltransferase involved in cell wall biosynthesis
MMLVTALIALALSALPALLFLKNLPLFCLRPEGGSASEAAADRSVSVLIPARDEEAGIADCVRTALASEGVEVEVLVLDDHSTDATADRVRDAQQQDDRVKLIAGKELPAGWNGKQHACKQLADSARFDRFVFLDADVRLQPHALRRLVDYQDRVDVGLLSAFPRQITATWLEQWLIPMMHFILLCYLPFDRMRSSTAPGFAAGCGQLFLTTRQAYQDAGTHEAIKQSRHDGLKLPRIYRENGIKTDVIDGTQLACCRMYRGAGEVIRGALKNAVEGIANPKLIVIFTLLLLGCSLFPVVTLIASFIDGNITAVVLSTIAVILAHVPRLVAARRLQQSQFGALCHVPATMTFVVLQWLALFNHLTGKKIAWRGRIES